METYFGLQIHAKKGKSAQDIAARLFLHPRMNAKQVESILALIDKKQLSYEVFIRKTDDGIAELKQWRDTGEDIPARVSKKYEEWNSVFNEPNNSDYEYIEKVYGIKKSDLFGSIVNISDVPHFNNARDIDSYLKRYIKGQDEAIEKISVPCWLHIHSKLNNYTSMIKPSVLLMGPTGVGKTKLLSIASKIFKAFGCPVVNIPATQFYAVGWQGGSIYNEIARELGKENNVDLRKPENIKYTVIIVDEIDKITSYRSSNSSNNTESGCYAKQDDVMHLMDSDSGQILNLELGARNFFSNENLELPLDNLLIIFSGAFEGIEDIIKRRLNLCPRIGFSGAKGIEANEENNVFSLVSNEDLISWGFTKEFVERIGTVITMNKLSTDDIYNIMLNAEDSILKSHIDYCLNNNVELHFSDEALYYIASQIKQLGGYRNAKSLLVSMLFPLYYNFPESKKRRIDINMDYVINRLRHIN